MKGKSAAASNPKVRSKSKKRPASGSFDDPDLSSSSDLDDLLFFTDTTKASSEDQDAATGSSAQVLQPPAKKKAKWHDDDDESTLVQLTQTNRLRKLRKTVDDDVVTGAELSTRLASHFTATSAATKGGSTPSWAMTPSAKREVKKERAEKAKKRKLAALVAGKALLDPAAANTKSGAPGASIIVPSDPIFDMDEFEPGEDIDYLDDNSSASLLASTAPLLRRSATHLPKDQLSVARLPNLTYTHSSVVSSVKFHPTANVLLTAGLDKTLRLSQVNGRDNPILSRVHFPDLPVHSLAIHPDGTHVVVTGRRNYAYNYHLETGAITRLPPIPHLGDNILPSLEHMHQSPSGKYLAFLGGSGNIVLIDAATHKWVCNLKMNGSLRAISWVTDNVLTSIGGDGVVYVWDIAERRCLAKWADHGGFKNGALGVGGDGRWLATGSYAGVVNVYKSTGGSEAEERFAALNGSSSSATSGKGLLSSTKPAASPVACMSLAKSLTNLTTPVFKVGFNHDAQVMAMFSRAKKDQFKLVHLPSCTVFANWPTNRTPLSYVQCYDFSPNSALVAIGNDKGRVLLYNLKGYPRY
ncbi:WD40-repeat-containing domain protein [Catenaria anguillulae PL171]|uniref:WD40-repeat-containing domain protein n=1 Tax=Catenaria anguillulae PL171 TaxID=765915 RepID=A0A1Y2HWT9_9FUNG|nr:WD40-repeat-containing domain protein [Catenaria anguillulae PL171]